MADKENIAVPQGQQTQGQQVHSNGIVITPLHDDLPTSVPAGYPVAERDQGAGACVAGKEAGSYQVYYNQPTYSQMQPGMPAAPPVQGTAVGLLNLSAPLYCPPTQDGPTFLGATVGHHPIAVHCGACGYQGLSHITCGLALPYIPHAGGQYCNC